MLRLYNQPQDGATAADKDRTREAAMADEMRECDGGGREAMKAKARGGPQVVDQRQ